MRFNLQSVSFNSLVKGGLIRAVMFIPYELFSEFRRLKIPASVERAGLEVHFFDQVEAIPKSIVQLLDVCGVKQDVLEKRRPALIEWYEQGTISVIGFDTIQDYWDRVSL